MLYIIWLIGVFISISSVAIGVGDYLIFNNNSNMNIYMLICMIFSSLALIIGLIIYKQNTKTKKYYANDFDY